MSARIPAFMAAGLDGESQRFDQPVAVTCCRCGEARQFWPPEYQPADRDTSSLGNLVAWAQGHQCPEGGAG